MMTAEMMDRRMRIFADGAVAASMNEPPTPPDILGSMERYTWFEGYNYKQPAVANPYRRRSRY